MSWRSSELIISLAVVMKQFAFLTAESSTEEPITFDQKINNFLNEENNESYSESEHPVGDQIGRIFQMMSVVLIVGCSVSFILIPLIAACVFNCCGFTRSGVRSNSYAALRHSRIGNVNSGTPFAEMQSMGTCKTCGENYCWIVLLLGIPAGVIFAIIAGVNTWPYM
ncbi:uncharacterized protein LOC124348369 isoform X2 [Daphnia pulicaria]|uniref:uncharacterized protein LOC124348369 isoform X2 n=1 Tax=Daphnia pulicaria TaxID=35523 RepID=UPI001EEA30E1|nr:uncharacterized protein LOC124348369 isoform X2 [Daphnia pulicaria]